NSINTKNYEADAFIAPDESYLIFCAKRKEGYGMGDLYISFKNKDGKWSEAKNMGKSINSEHHELCPFVTKDGKYVFFTSNKYIYCVSSDIINQYRYILPIITTEKYVNYEFNILPNCIDHYSITF